jgi:DNA polymerase-3 subunit beta
VKFSTSAAELLSQLQTVSRVASTRSANLVLAGVQVVAEGGRVELRATDTEIGLRVPLSATVERDGVVVLPARLLLDVARALPGSDASVDAERRTRAILTGILVSAGGTELRMVATDSYRLSVQETTLSTPLEGSFEANVPGRALEELARIASSAETITATVRENQIVFVVGETILSSRLIDGQFPDYRKLLPDTFEHELTFASGELTDVVRRISLMAQKNAPLRLSFGEGELRISAQTPDVGEAEESLPTPFAGEPFEIGFNPEFLRDGLESVDDADLVLQLISPLRPGLIASADGSGFRYLIMPIRLNV